jgi:NADP-dependent 3-hydroxy acid dehydrogenase YdfG
VAAQDLSGRRVLVTGASSGIGAATARACAEGGARVALLARRTDRIADLAEEIGGTAITADVTDPTAVAEAVDAAADALDGLDAVVNNAGVLRTGHIADQAVEDWQAMLDTNVLGLLVVTQAAIPHLRRAGGGDMVLMSSMSGRRVPGDRSGVYAGTKHAVHAIAQSLRRELHADGVRVSLVSPGFVATDIAEAIPDAAQREALSSQVAELGIDPLHVARAVTRILSDPPEVSTLEVAIVPSAQET